MTDRDILAQAQIRARDAVGYLDSTLVKQRERATKYYRGDLFGNELEGRSQVVSRDVAQYIDTVLPSLMRIFSGGDEVVRFEPQEPGDEQAAEQATDYVNWIWNQQNNGFVNFHHWFKDGLLNKMGVLKIWWDATPETTKERYQGLTEAEFKALESDEDIEVVETAESVSVSVDQMTGQPIMEKAYDCEVVKTNRQGCVRIEPVPPEEFLFGRRARNDRDCDILAHRTQKPRADLLAAGFDRDTVEALFSGDDGLMTSERLTRFTDVDDAPMRINPPVGGATEVEVVEAYLHLDVDDDGGRKYCRVTWSGNHLLEWEEVDDHPFAMVSPILMPHRLVGMSMSDQLEDIQLIKSTVMRGVLDNLYLQNAPQMGAVIDQVNLDDLMTRRPGGVIRMKTPGALFPVPTTPLGQEPYSMIEYMDTMAEQRTGATRYNQGLDANTLNKTATGINLIQNAAAQRIELIARVYAETGVKRAFRVILKLVCAHQQKAKMVKLRNTWVEMDPRAWRDSMDMTVSVGVGNGNKDQIVAHMMALLQLDEKLVQFQGGANGPLVTLDNIYAKLKLLVQGIGIRGIEAYYTDPASQAQAPQQPKPDPKMAEVQARIQLEQMQAQARMQLEQQKAQHEAQLDQMRAELEMALSQRKAEQQAQLDQMKAQDRANEAPQRQAPAVAMQLGEGAERAMAEALAQIGQVVAQSSQAASMAAQASQQSADVIAQAAQSMGEMMRHMSAPKRVVRDEGGRAVGVESVLPQPAA
jgi:hypothetical protein